MQSILIKVLRLRQIFSQIFFYWMVLVFENYMRYGDFLLQ